MTSGRLLARNTFWNLSAQLLPVLVALIAVRILIHGLGAERFGVLTLAWAAIGYFSLFDLGLGRALTQTVSSSLGTDDIATLGTKSATSLLLMALLGLAGGIALAALSPVLIDRFLNIPVSLRRESLVAFYIMAASLPFVVMTAGLRGILEAHQHFGIATALRLPYAIFTFVAPVVVLRWTPSLIAIVAVLVAGRVLLWAAHLTACLREYAFLRRAHIGSVSAVSDLLRLGGWMTLSNVVSPLMVTLDRFLIGAIISIAAVTYYVTPYEMVIQLLLIPGAVLGVMFPAFATTYSQSPGKTATLFDGTLRVMLFLVFPATLVLVAFSREILALWIGGAFPERSATIMQILAAGVFVNSVGQVSATALQAIGRPDLPAKLHVVELPLYLLAIYVLGTRYGLNGVAMAWTLRIMIDTSLLSWSMRDRVPGGRDTLLKIGGAMVALGATLAVAATLASRETRIAAVSIVLVAFVATAWRKGLRASERAAISGLLRLRSAGVKMPPVATTTQTD